MEYLTICNKAYSEDCKINCPHLKPHSPDDYCRTFKECEYIDEEVECVPHEESLLCTSSATLQN